MASVGFVGSRSLSPVFASVVSRVVSLVFSSGRSVAVGCASGADAFALSAALSSLPAPGASPSLFVFSAFGPGGFASAGRASAVPLVSAAFARSVSPGHGLSAPVVVRFWSGGQPGVPLRVRLAARSATLVSAVAGSGPGAGLVAFVAGGLSASRGSWLAVGRAVAAGLPVLVFACGCSPGCFPSFGRVSWVRSGSGLWRSAWRAVPIGEQLPLFE